MTVRGTSNKPAKRDLTKVVENARRWVVSAEGQAKLSNSQRSALETTERLQEARRVDPKGPSSNNVSDYASETGSMPGPVMDKMDTLFSYGP